MIYRILNTCLFVGLLSACGGGGNSDSGASIIPKNQNLERCLITQPTVATAYNDYCSLKDLTYIGQDSSRPSLETIRSRIHASQPWMEQRFMEFLEDMPPATLSLMKSITGVVINKDVRPSHFNALTGAMYVDPGHLWLTAEELASVSTDADYREEYAAQFEFTHIWRYVKDNQHYAPASNSVQSRSRTQVFGEFASLLFHELAHANDFVSSSTLASLDETYAPYDVVVQYVPLSYELSQEYPLTSTQLHDLGQVFFQGAEATDALKSLSGEEVGNLFYFDQANDFYSYSHGAEDLAMLFEEFMMRTYFDVQRDVAFVEIPEAATDCDQVKIAWGQRDRILNTAVRTRLRYVLARLSPDLAAASTSVVDNKWGNSIEQDLPNTGWCDAIEMQPGNRSRERNSPALPVPAPQHYHHR